MTLTLPPAPNQTPTSSTPFDFTLRQTRNDLRWLVGLILLAMLMAFPVLTYPMGRDQGMYANIARTILNGGLPFVDMWDIKPPAIYYVYAAAVAVYGDGAAALRALDLTFLPFTLIALYGLGVRITNGNHTAGFLAGLLFTVFYFTETFASLTQSDSLITLPMTLAVGGVVLAGDSPLRGRRVLAWSAWAGMWCALLMWFKHYYALIVVALVLEHVIWRWRQTRRFPIREALAFALGGLPVGVLPLAYFMANGVWGEMLIVAGGTSAYNAQSTVGLDVFIAQIGHYAQFRWAHWGVLIVLALLWFIPHPTQLSAPPSAARWRLVWIWLIAAFAFMLVQAKGFDTHWLPMLPPFCLFAASGVVGASRRLSLRLSVRYLAVIWVILIVGLCGILLKDTWLRALPYITGQEGQRAYYARFQSNDVKPAESLQVIRFLQRNTSPGDTLFIWGFRPEVYYLSGLRPATRFQAQFPLAAAWWPSSWKQEAVETLWAALPPYVLVLRADYMPWVTGSNDDSNTLLTRFKPLEDWLIYNYERVEPPIGDFLIWQRKANGRYTSK